MILKIELECDHPGCRKTLTWDRPAPFVYQDEWDVEGYWNERDELVVGKAYCPDHAPGRDENRPYSEEMVNRLAEDIRTGLWKKDDEFPSSPSEKAAG